MPTQGSDRRLAAILFADIVGYTALMGDSEEAGLRVRERHRTLVRPIVERYHGTWIEEVGDESLSTFPSAVDAVNCALAIQEATADEPDLRLRIGIHLGDIVVEAGRIYGDGVNVGSRIRPLAEPGGICVSGEVYSAVRNQSNVEAEPLGERDLKNVRGHVAVFRIGGAPQLPRTIEPARLGVARRVRLPGAAAIVLLLCVVPVGAWLAWRAFVPSHPEIGSVAVLPLTALSSEAEQAYFSEGMTDALIGGLARIGSLRVVSRTSAQQHRDASGSLPEIAEELAVDAVIEGSVFRAGSQVRITLQLVDGSSGLSLWSGTYERDLQDILALQSEVAQEVAREIAHELTPSERARFVSAPVNAVAYEATMRGRHSLGSLTPGDHQLSVRYFQQALRADPKYAPAYAGLADAYT